MSLNPGQVKLYVRRTSVQVLLEPKVSIASTSAYLRTCVLEITSDLCDNVAGDFFFESLMAAWLEQVCQ